MQQEPNFIDELRTQLLILEIKINAPKFIIDGEKIGHDGIKTFQYNIRFGTKYRDFGIEFLTIESIVELAKRIKEEVGKEIYFAELILPRKAVVLAQHNQTYDGILARYLEDYLAQTDEIVKRWDVLVYKAS